MTTKTLNEVKGKPLTVNGENKKENMYLHWNYFVALENDMQRVSRFIEFCPENLNVFSLELARILFAAASEVDVIAKSLCGVLSLKLPKNPNIDAYRKALMPLLPELSCEEVFVIKTELDFKPWKNWSIGTNPSWWQSYNNVKHERDKFFNEATLNNALDALAGLLIITLYHFRESMKIAKPTTTIKDVTLMLGLHPTLLTCKDDYYYKYLVVNN